MTPPDSPRPLQQRSMPALALLAFVGGAVGCASLDPTPDIDRAASTVADRSGATPIWTEPWEASLTTWDGRADLELDQAVAMALRNNRELRAQVERIAAARADLVQAGLLPNPVVSLTLRFPFDPADGATFVGASLVQQFTALWLRDGRIRAADARLNETVLDVSDRAVRLAAEVRRSHARIAHAERALDLAAQNAASADRLLDALIQRERAGESAALDVARARRDAATIRAELAEAQRNLDTESRRMLELIGFAAESARWRVAPTPPAPPPSLSEPDAVAVALAQRLDIAAARAVVLSHEAELSLEEASRVRELGLGLDYERETDGAQSIGPVLEAEIPIFDFNQAQIAKAGSLARAALASYEATTQRAVREARNAWITADAAARMLESQSSAVLPAAERAMTLSESAVSAGAADVTTLLEAQREWLTARRALSDLELAATLARIDLEEALGGMIPLPSALPDPPAQARSFQ